MSESSRAKPEPPPGHYGAGYGEQAPTQAPLPPAQLESAADAPAGLEPVTTGLEPFVTGIDADSSAASADEAGAPVVFTADDVAARPPDRAPTEAAPASEKAGLIFERS